MSSGLIIFDCDGVLVDSETIACRIETGLLKEIGHTIGYNEFCRRAVGRSRKDTNAMLEEFWGRALPADWAERVRAVTLDAFAAELRPVPGIASVLDGLGDRPRCVASSSSPSRIARSLELTGLAHYFGSDIFSASEVKHGKPAPDLFLYAAARMGAEPTSCTVIEDSVPGIEAAAAAGMRAVGFTAGSHCQPGHEAVLKAAGADAVATDAAALAALLENERGRGHS